jgi:hypothetical protein
MEVADTTPPSILSSAPSNGTKSVSVIESLQATFSEALDSSTVSSATVMLSYSKEIRGAFLSLNMGSNISMNQSIEVFVEGTVSLDPDSNMITFNSTSALEYGQKYSLQFSGIKDLAGNNMVDASLEFETFINPRIFSNVIGPDGKPMVAEFFYDSEGNGIESIHYESAGDDGKWETSDDVVRNYHKRTYDANGNVINTTMIFDSGPDGTWFTSDDFAFRNENKYDSNGRIIWQASINDPGDDGTWFTSDDSVGGYTGLTYDAEGKIIRLVNYMIYSANVSWSNKNDSAVPYQYSDADHDDNGNLISVVSYSDVGGDGAWFTSDDVVSRYSSYAYDDVGRMTRYSFFPSPGEDSIWFTSDDISYSYGYVYDSDSNMIQHVVYEAPGEDGEWMTSDDEVSYYFSLGYDGSVITNQQLYTKNGEDGEWFTFDDIVSEYVACIQDSFGRITYTISYTDKGLDALWDTSDDTVSSYALTEYDELGNRTTISRCEDPGADAEWFTNDDVLIIQTRYDTTF